MPLQETRRRFLFAAALGIGELTIPGCINVTVNNIPATQTPEVKTTEPVLPPSPNTPTSTPPLPTVTVVPSPTQRPPATIEAIRTSTPLSVPERESSKALWSLDVIYPKLPAKDGNQPSYFIVNGKVFAHTIKGIVSRDLSKDQSKTWDTKPKDVIINADSESVYVADTTGNVIVFDHQGNQQFTITPPKGLGVRAAESRGRFLAIATQIVEGRITAQIIDRQNPKSVIEKEGYMLASNNRFFFSGAAGGLIELTDADTGKLVKLPQRQGFKTKMGIIFGDISTPHLLRHEDEKDFKSLYFGYDVETQKVVWEQEKFDPQRQLSYGGQTRDHIVFKRKLANEPKGEIVGINRKTGQVEWRHETSIFYDQVFQHKEWLIGVVNNRQEKYTFFHNPQTGKAETIPNYIPFAISFLPWLGQNNAVALSTESDRPQSRLTLFWITFNPDPKVVKKDEVVYDTPILTFGRAWMGVHENRVIYPKNNGLTIRDARSGEEFGFVPIQGAFEFDVVNDTVLVETRNKDGSGKLTTYKF